MSIDEKLKPLEWRDKRTYLGPAFAAEALNGLLYYRIHSGAGGRWFGYCNDGGIFSDLSSEEAAKQAAQSHFAATVMAAFRVGSFE